MRRICRYCGRQFEGDPGANACPDCVESRRHVVMLPRICRTCGIIFRGGPRAWYCPECRAERRRQHDREAKSRAKAGATRPIGSTAYCDACGMPYSVRGGLQRYCPDCAPELVRRHAIEGAKAWNAVHATPEQRKTVRKAHAAPIRCVVCGRQFVPASAAVTCSGECSAKLAKRQGAEYEHRYQEERNAYHRERAAKRVSEMSDVERSAYRDKINARARENYKKRKEKGK